MNYELRRIRTGLTFTEADVWKTLKEAGYGNRQNVRISSSEGLIKSSDNPTGSNWDLLKSRIRVGISEQIMMDGSIGDISRYIRRPNFTGNLLSDPSYAIILGGTQEITVICHGLKQVYTPSIINSQGAITPGYYGFDADVEIVVKDWFGVSEADITEDDLATTFAGSSLSAFWILQHQRGFKPFINEYHFREKITHRKNIY